MKFLVVGAGVSGAVVARVLAEAGHLVDVVDRRPHVAGNCHTERDAESGVMVHRYGPHLFHTKRQRVVSFLERFTEFHPNQHRVRATTRTGVYSMPLNLLSMNQFFGTRFGPREMRAHVDARRDRSIEQPTTFEEQAISMMGDELYQEFFAGYTEKQWGRSPTSLPASILKRLPMRFEYDDRYFADPYEFLPVDGYTAAVERMLAHDGVRVELGVDVGSADGDGYDHVVWTGPLDAYFGHAHGRLAYRTLDFDWQTSQHPYQGCSVMNYCDADVAHTRIAEHNYFQPWEHHETSVVAVETSRECGPDDIPYYPVRLTDDQALLAQYLSAADELEGVTFVGRLGTYRYLDMDASIDEALTAAETFLECIADRRPLPTFCVDPSS